MSQRVSISCNVEAVSLLAGFGEGAVSIIDLKTMDAAPMVKREKIGIKMLALWIDGQKLWNPILLR